MQFQTHCRTEPQGKERFSPKWVRQRDAKKRRKELMKARAEKAERTEFGSGR